MKRTIILSLMIFANIGFSKVQAFNFEKLKFGSGVFIGTIGLATSGFQLGELSSLLELKERLNKESTLSMSALEEQIKEKEVNNCKSIVATVLSALLLKYSYDRYPA